MLGGTKNYALGCLNKSCLDIQHSRFSSISYIAFEIFNNQ